MTDRRILLIEPYLGGSHAAWAEGWRAWSRHDITVLGHEGRHWRWRMRGSAVTLAADAAAHLEATGAPDLLVTTNMLDLASFRGLAHPSLRGVPAVQFLHENQLSYPRRPGEALDTGLAWTQWLGLLAADEVWINSEHHRLELLAGMDALLATAPDHAHDDRRADLVETMHVAHLGVDVDACRRTEPYPAGPRRPLVVSNHRWHHDKDVGSVLRALRTAAAGGLEFDVALLGDPDGGEADELDHLVDELGDRIVVRGHLHRPAYLAVLQRADVVVSAARNENFGLAVAEAIAAGAWPVLPHALAYPEVVPTAYHDGCLYPEGGLGTRLRDVLARVAAGASAPAGLAASMERFAWPVVAAGLDDRVDELLARSRAV